MCAIQDVLWMLLSLADDDQLGKEAVRQAGALELLVQALRLRPLSRQVSNDFQPTFPSTLPTYITLDRWLKTNWSPGER